MENKTNVAKTTVVRKRYVITQRWYAYVLRRVHRYD